jgi:hypothetical protein
MVADSMSRLWSMKDIALAIDAGAEPLKKCKP